MKVQWILLTALMQEMFKFLKLQFEIIFLIWIQYPNTKSWKSNLSMLLVILTIKREVGKLYYT